MVRLILVGLLTGCASVNNADLTKCRAAPEHATESEWAKLYAECKGKHDLLIDSIFGNAEWQKGI
jgi:hypothetical protein